MRATFRVLALMMHRAPVVLGFALLVACGGGSGSSGPAAPTALRYPTPPAMTVGHVVAPLVPSVAGMVDSYSVSPALPAGLTISVTSGVISGTPSVVSPKANYTVTATNGGGSTSTQLSLTINDLGPVVAYSSAYFSFTRGIASRPLQPASTGGAVLSWNVSPVLPAGLTLNTRPGSPRPITHDPSKVTP